MAYDYKYFMGEFCDYGSAKVVVLPVPFERSTSYMRGTAAGPAAIIAASYNVELYDLQLDDAPYRYRIHTFPSFQFSDDLPIDGAINQIEQATTAILQDNKFPVVLGGEHTLSYSVFCALNKYHPNLSVLHLDAHTDLRDQYLDDPFSHACVMRRIREYTKNIVSIGIRSVSPEEVDYIKQERPIIFYDHQIRTAPLPIEQILSALSENVFITFDLDAISPAELPSVGTPEPGGLNWYQVADLFEAVFAYKNVVGFDVVELKPDGINVHSDFWAAKMIYKMIGLKLKGRR
ncbi:MAG: agmatinase [candidate division KSB1 bacterium]|nr:agmatinase [candidate division KSB1 bacterium]